MNKQAIRKALFAVCKSKEELDRWIRVFLQIRLPDRVVSEESTGSPLDLIWQLYDRAVRNDTDGWKRVMAYASRFSGKCVKKGTLLRTPNGYLPIEEAKIGDIIWSGWAWRKVTDWVHDGVKPGVTVELEYGQRLTGSLQHRVWAWSPHSKPDWKRIADLESEDQVALDIEPGVKPFSWQKVKTLTFSDADFYDLTVEKDHSYWSDGFVSHNTLAASILETILLLHTPRNIVHMAAIKDQSRKAQEYVKGFYYRDHLRDFVVGDNDTEIKVVAFLDKNGIPINDKEYQKLSPSKQLEYKRKENYIRIIVCTMQSTNGQHSEFMCVDGQTSMAVRNVGGVRVNRKRVSMTAKGVFRAIQDKSPTGRYKEVEGSITPSVVVDMATFDWASGSIQFRPITYGVCRKAKTIRISTSSRNLIASTDHQIWVLGKGNTALSEVSPGDKAVVLGKGRSYGRNLMKDVRRPKYETGPLVPVDDDDWYQVLLGSLLGDAGIYKKPTNNAYYSERHCLEQEDYFNWKLRILGRHLRLRKNKGATSGYTGKEQIAYASGNTPMLNEFVSFKKDFNEVERLGPLGLAVWYMDDGNAGNGLSISSCGFTLEQNQRLVALLKSKFGIECRVSEYDGYPYIRGGIDAKRRLVEICKPFIHPSMAYKFDVSRNIGKCRFCQSEFWFYERHSNICTDPVCVALGKGKLKVDVITSVEALEERYVYDFTVDGTNNFFTNSLLSKQCIDEVDVIPKGNLRAYDQAKNGIPTDRGNNEAMTLFTSTRKSRVGKVQQEIDAAEKSGLRLLHWNVIDITEPCPEDRYKPNEPKKTYWINDADVNHISDEEYDFLPETDKPKYYAKEGFAGCAKCPLFAACKGDLATKQSGKVADFEDGGTALLLKIDTVIDKFRGATPEFITTEFLCRKPDTSGLVYPRLKEEIHKKTAAQIAEEIEGEPVPSVIDKPSLMTYLVNKGVKFASGLDWGYSHLFAVVTLAVWGHKAYVVDAIGLPKQELDDKLTLCEPLKALNSTIFADPEESASIATFRRKGFKMKEWSKNAGSVKAGIDIARAKLWSKQDGPTLFFLKDDRDVEILYNNVRDYHYTTGPDGKFTEIPDDTDDDLPDAWRYAVMNVFSKNGALKTNLGLVAVPKATIEEHWTAKASKQNTQIMQNFLQGITGDRGIADASATKPIKKGGFSWNP